MAFGQHSSARLAPRTIQFRKLVLPCTRHVDAVERGIDVRCESTITPHGFSRREPSWRKCHSFEMDCQWTLALLAYGLLCVLQVLHHLCGVCLQVSHVARQCGNRFLLLGRLRSRRIRFRLSLGNHRLILVEPLFQLLNALIAALNLLTELLNLLLLRLNRQLQLRQFFGDRIGLRFFSRTGCCLRLQTSESYSQYGYQGHGCKSFHLLSPELQKK